MWFLWHCDVAAYEADMLEGYHESAYDKSVDCGMAIQIHFSDKCRQVHMLAFACNIGYSQVVKMQ